MTRPSKTTRLTILFTILATCTLGLALLSAGACGGGDAASGESATDNHAAEGHAGDDHAGDQDEHLDAMASEHHGDEPIATPATYTEAEGRVIAGDMVYGSLGDHSLTGYMARPMNPVSPRPGIVVIHEWWGLNDNIRAMTRKLAGLGYNALAVDLYHGEVADTPEQARELAGSLDEAETLRNLEQARAALGAEMQRLGDTRSDVGVLGWCLGGGWALRTGLDMPEAWDAVVIYYGRLVTDPDELEALEAPVLGIFGAEDQGIPVEDVRAFEEALESLDKEAEIHVYEGAGHAFANPSGTRYEPEAAEDAWRQTRRFLATHLQGWRR